MKTNVLFEKLDANITSRLRFILPNGREIQGDFHFTEVKSVNVKSMDCGSNKHIFNETIIQIWVNERSEKEAEWSGGKAVNILNKVGSKQRFDLESEVFFEYGDSISQTAKYSIETMYRVKDDLIVRLFVKPTECKPSRNQELVCC
ncbi:MAG: DUF6428 family protein [Balneola sp.]